MPLNLTLVKPESELAHIPAQVLFADMMIGAIDSALQERPDGFDAVGRDADPRSAAATAVFDRMKSVFPHRHGRA